MKFPFTQLLTAPPPILILPILICVFLRGHLSKHFVSNFVSSVISSRAYGTRTVAIRNHLSKQILKWDVENESLLDSWSVSTLDMGR